MKLLGTTGGFKNDLEVSCVKSAGADRVYAFTAKAPGIVELDAAVEQGFNAALEVRGDACNSAAKRLLCLETQSKGVRQVFEVEQGKTYWLILDAVDTTSGNYSITLSMP